MKNIQYKSAASFKIFLRLRYKQDEKIIHFNFFPNWYFKEKLL